MRKPDTGADQNYRNRYDTKCALLKAVPVYSRRELSITVNNEKGLRSYPKSFYLLVPRTRFERVTYGLEGRCSVQLSYRGALSA